jgi:pilus assembly protein CpaB
MKPAKIAVLGIALLSAGGAVMLMNSGGTPPPPPPLMTEAAPPIRMAEVLVAAADLPMGQNLKPADLRWQNWPVDGVPPGAITRSDAPKGVEDMTGSLVRSAFLVGEPIRREKLIKADGSGFMSAILPAGMRAVAISIDTRGATTAGGFILPNDRVDVLRTYRDDEAARAGGGESHMAETILSNIRVLAIGQNVQERNGERVVTGETATLELTPGQSEQVVLAQKTGQLSLVLRSLADANAVETPREEKAETGLTVVRYGVSKQTSKR